MRVIYLEEAKSQRKHVDAQVRLVHGFKLLLERDGCFLQWKLTKTKKHVSAILHH